MSLYDQSAAFDLMDFHTIEDKMRALNMGEDIINWYMEFLTERSQYVYIEGAESDPIRTYCGAPQGSSSGPLLWLIFTLDLPEEIEYIGNGEDIKE